LKNEKKVKSTNRHFRVLCDSRFNALGQTNLNAKIILIFFVVPSLLIVIALSETLREVTIQDYFSLLVQKQQVQKINEKLINNRQGYHSGAKISSIQKRSSGL
jgi:hypothetical protein